MYLVVHRFPSQLCFLTVSVCHGISCNHDQLEQNRVRAIQPLLLLFLLHLSQDCKVGYTRKELDRRLTRRSQRGAKSEDLEDQTTPGGPDPKDQAIPYIVTAKAPTNGISTTMRTMTKTTATTTTNAGSQLTKVVIYVIFVKWRSEYFCNILLF